MIVHKIVELYKTLYQNNKSVSKQDRHGLRAKTEQNFLFCLQVAIEAALSVKNLKLPIVQKLRVEIEVGKQLVRLETELNIIGSKFYCVLQEKLQEISRMCTGWINYLQKKEP